MTDYFCQWIISLRTSNSDYELRSLHYRNRDYQTQYLISPKCRRCTYQTKNAVDYYCSIRRQKIVIMTGEFCIRCRYHRYVDEMKEYELNDNEIINRFRVDLTKTLQ